MRQMRLRTVMIAIAVIAVLLGIGMGFSRRSQRLYSLSLRYGREANRLDLEWVKAAPLAPGQPDLLMEKVHWHDSVAYAYFSASSRPWVPFDPEPKRITCSCGFHKPRRSLMPQSLGATPLWQREFFYFGCR